MLKRGFTIVELVVVITVIGILAAIITVAYTGWREEAIANSLKSDLIALSGEMEKAKSFNQTYPTSIPATFTTSNTTVLSLDNRSTARHYCATATTPESSSISFYIGNNLQNPEAGTCAANWTPSLIVPTTPVGTATSNPYGTPTNPTASNELTYLSLQWAEPTSNGGSPVTNYRIRLTFEGQCQIYPTDEYIIPNLGVGQGTYSTDPNRDWEVRRDAQGIYSMLLYSPVANGYCNVESYPYAVDKFYVSAGTVDGYGPELVYEIEQP